MICRPGAQINCAASFLACALVPLFLPIPFDLPLFSCLWSSLPLCCALKEKWRPGEEDSFEKAKQASWELAYVANQMST
jgi:hypothetical protein